MLPLTNTEYKQACFLLKILLNPASPKNIKASAPSFFERHLSCEIESQRNKMENLDQMAMPHICHFNYTDNR